jgi:hypothetical protein
MTESVVVTLALACLSGITLIAYRHPVSYKRLYAPLMCLVVLVWAVVFFFTAGYQHGFHVSAMQTIRLNAGSAKIPELAPSEVWPYAIAPLPIVYFSLLYFLPTLGISGEKSKDEKPENPVDKDRSDQKPNVPPN